MSNIPPPDLIFLDKIPNVPDKQIRAVHLSKNNNILSVNLDSDMNQ